jgi:hypothetical protein
MALADAEYSFTYMNVGSYGKMNDSNILKSTNVGQQLYLENLNVPKPEPLSSMSQNQSFPFVFVAD